MHALLMWGNRYREVNTLLFKHAVCGIILDSGACPACGLTPVPEDVLTESLRKTERDGPVAITLRRPHRLLEPIQASDEGKKRHHSQPISRRAYPLRPDHR